MCGLLLCAVQRRGRAMSKSGIVDLAEVTQDGVAWRGG